MPNLLDPTLVRTFARDKVYLEQTKLPILTVSATFREDVKGFHGFKEDETISIINFHSEIAELSPIFENFILSLVFLRIAQRDNLVQ